MSEQILNCALATCGRRFYPTSQQLGRAKGRKAALYCSQEHQREADRERMRTWWASPEGRAYQAERRAKAKRKRRGRR